MKTEGKKISGFEITALSVEERRLLCLFLISLKAGGMGLNLTAANYVLLLDPWWNPAVENQAADRVHRIGQKNPVTVYRLIASDTVEERVLELHKEKKSIAEDVLDGAASTALTPDELMRLFK